MERNAYKYLTNWLKDEYRKPLIIYGQRQIGKTYLIKEMFAKNEFKKYIYVDFKVDNDIRRFIKNNVDADKIIQYLSLVKQIDIDSDTLIIFDEVQECMPLLTSLKYFCQNHKEIPIIATGSMVRIKITASENNKLILDSEIEEENQDNTNNYMFPTGKVDEYIMHPMTFDEYLKAANEKLYEFVKNGFSNKIAFSNEEHNLIMKYFYDYMIIGGMPESVDIFLKTNDYNKARKNLKNIYDNYLNDMSLYQISNQTIIRTKKVFDNIYLQLNKENKNFKFSYLEKGKKYRDYENPLLWLSLAGLIIESHIVKEHISFPLVVDEESLFRIYLPDTGLFAIQSMITPDTFIDSSKQNSLMGIFFENYVACELNAREYKLFYWKGKSTSEIEFLIPSKGDIIPLDCKKNKGSLDSLAKYREHNKNNLAIKVSNNKYGYDEKNKLLTLPFYYLPFYLDEIKNK